MGLFAACCRLSATRLSFSAWPTTPVASAVAARTGSRRPSAHASDQSWAAAIRVSASAEAGHQGKVADRPERMSGVVHGHDRRGGRSLPGLQAVGERPEQVRGCQFRLPRADERPAGDRGVVVTLVAPRAVEDGVVAEGIGQAGQQLPAGAAGYLWHRARGPRQQVPVPPAPAQRPAGWLAEHCPEGQRLPGEPVARLQHAL